MPPKADPTRMTTVVCDFCGKEFSKRTRLVGERNFCCHPCSASYTIAQCEVVINCAQCGKEVHTTKGRTGRKYCSNACVMDARYGSGRKIISSCVTCGKEIVSTLKSPQKHCSKECAFESMRVDGAAWRDPEYIKLYQRKYQREWYKKNRARILELNKIRDEKEPERRRMHAVRRRTKQAELPNDFTDKDWVKCLEYWNYRCAVCEKPQSLFNVLAADHWIPIANPDCLGTVPHNIIPLCHGENGCNNSKSKRDGATWLEQRLGKRKAAKRLKMIMDYLNSVRR